MALDTHPRLKAAFIRAVRHPSIVVPTAHALQLAGVHRLGRRLLVLNGAEIPPVVIADLPGALFYERTLTMATANGRDMLVAGIWSKGWDRYERPLPLLWAASIKDGDVVLDIGSNTGFYALLAASVGSDVQVHAFEPNPHVFEQLITNLAYNAQGARVRPVQMAADNVPGQGKLFIPHQGIPGIVVGNASLNDSLHSSWLDTVMVSKTTLDEYTRNLAHVDVVKIDVETLEDRVLDGARETLRWMRPVIFYEVLDRANCASIDAIRRESDYLSVQLSPRGMVIKETVGYNGPWCNQALWPAEKLGMLRVVSQWLGHRLRSEVAAAEEPVSAIRG